MEWAKNSKKHIVLAEGTDERILRATASRMKLWTLPCLGKPMKFRLLLNDLILTWISVKIKKIVYPAEDAKYDDYVSTLYELRKSKNVTMEMARDLMTDVSYFGTMMVYKGDADGMVSGAVNTTLHTIRPALQFIKTKPGISVVSSVFFMCLPDRVSVLETVP